MSEHDETHDLHHRLHRHTDGMRPTSDLVAGSLARARRIRRHRTIVATVTAVVVAGGGIAGAGALRGLWDDGGVPVAGATATPTPTPTGAATPSTSRVTTAPSSPTPSDAVPSPDPSDPGSGASTPRSTTPAPPPPADSSPPTDSSPPASGSRRPSANSTSGAPDRIAACTASDTTVEARPVQGSAGHVEYLITMTNDGDQPCTVEGYPGVSIVAGDDGTQVGAPADRDRSRGNGEPVTVRPGATATASVLVAQADNYGDDCDPVDARGFRIYLPGQRAAQFAPVDVRGCANPDIHLMRVRPFTPA